MEHALRPAHQYADLYGAVFSAAERVDSWDGIGMPNDAQTGLWRALDRMKDLGMPAADVRSAEAMSVTMHRIALALRRPSAEMEAGLHKDELARLARQWLGQLPMALSR